jgi:hypothetical protein
MARAQARAHPGAEIDESTLEVRWLPDGPEEWQTTGGPNLAREASRVKRRYNPRRVRWLSTPESSGAVQ